MGQICAIILNIAIVFEVQEKRYSILCLTFYDKYKMNRLYDCDLGYLIQYDWPTQECSATYP